MNKESFITLGRLYHEELIGNVLPFWEKYSPDRECGGYFTCLERDGSVFDTDKFSWPQLRQVWMFSKLYRDVEARESWLEMARSGWEFLRRHAMDANGQCYFSLDRTGKSLTAPHSIFSDCFAAMAFCQYGLAADDADACAEAVRLFDSILRRRDNPKGIYTKTIQGTRPLASLAVPMILLNLCSELSGILDPALARSVEDECLADVFHRFVEPETLVVRENVAPDGSAVDCFEGRVLLPGHAIEVMWFVLDLAELRGDAALIAKATEAMLRALERGWDEKYGGIFYFLDAHGHPPQQLEWDQKLWWVHVETLVGLLKAARLTGRPECLQWFQRVHDYTWAHFPDPEFGEWFGYHNRQGEPLLTLKGGKWKGCYHLPRGLLLCARELDLLASAPPPPSALL